MTRKEQLTNQINENTAKLLNMNHDSQEALELRHEQVILLTTREDLTIWEEEEVI